MRIFRRRPVVTDANEIAMHVSKHSGGGRITAIGTVIALVFSAYSLWETSLKQAKLEAYVTGVVTYTRDATDEYLAPAGGFEVFAVPVTIANSGARDAAVLSLQLEAKNPKTGLIGRFDATYIVDAAYFAIRREGERPKAPFSALVIAGRSAWAGTILFYPVTYSNEKALAPAGELQQKIMALRDKHGSLVELEKKLREKNEKMPELDELDAYREKVLVSDGTVDITVKLLSPEPNGWLDRALDAPVPPVALTLQLPGVGENHLTSHVIRLRSAAARS
jgi:hypothetical protein